ncbi:phBC6A51 family helix-turn-helix protein [Desulfotomaculum copahuensis]|uniref:Homeodomain phBC6A51-type domain-containing protein n=1 Tax=Desulfotomaculum copahuensis TaxID=1838280 RepID=A0A1B7LF15_9FIRM|nr:phBC6A51 family helix-turn-helix protein [Desulfotomaculum copahuensis]OAT82230.1 hypothetical protein A6M21_08660 [Desulfotomaculum copahuensis]
MAGGSKKSSTKQELALVTLLESPSIGEAARKVGIGERTLWRWLQNPEFSERYRELKQQILHQAVSRLQSICGEAVNTLRDVMLDPKNLASARVTAARTVLEMAIKAAELEDLTARLEELERLAGVKSKGAVVR